MTVSATSTFEQTPPLRPGESDVLTGVKSNGTPTVPTHIPSAEEFMQMARLLVAAMRMVPIARISVEFTAGTPAIQSFVSIRGDATAADFTLTDNGAGDTSITVAAGRYTAGNTKATASLNDAVGGNPAPSVESITNGVRVRTKNSLGVATDVAFTVEIFSL